MSNLAKVARKPGSMGVASVPINFSPVHIEKSSDLNRFDRKGEVIENYSKNNHVNEYLSLDSKNIIEVQTYDEEIMNLVNEEAERQRKSIDLIASSNIPIAGVNEWTMLLGNKSSPGYPSGRFFNGDQCIDKVEKIWTKRALDAFHLEEKNWHANVQSLSGSMANLCAFNAICEPGDTILALWTKVGGGHHTYGVSDENDKPTNLYSKIYNFEYYHLKENGQINYENAYKTAMKVRPKVIIAGSSTYPREIDWKKFRRIWDESGAIMMADIAHGFGLKIAKVWGNPFPLADIVTASTSKSMRGPRAGVIYSKKRYAKAVDNSVFPGVMGAPQNNSIGSLAITF